MKTSTCDVLEAVAECNDLCFLLGKFAVDESLGARFLSEPEIVLAELKVTIQPSEAELLRHTLMTLDNFHSAKRQRIMELGNGAEALIRSA